MLDEYKNVPEEVLRKNCWVKTGEWQVLSRNTVQLKNLTPGISLYAKEKILCDITFNDDGVKIVPAAGANVSIQKDKEATLSKITSPIKFNHQQRIGVSYLLHIGVIQEAHYVWHFIW